MAERCGRLICILGAPGSGKGTQGAMIARALRGRHVSVGDLLRTHKVAGHRIARDPRTRLADTAQTCQLINGAAGLRGCVVLDGFPRHADQVAALDQLAWPCERVLWLEVDFTAAVDRMKRRGREGESTAQIAMRQFRYEQSRQPLMDAFRDRGVPVHLVDANGPPGSVLRAALAVIPSSCE